MKSLDKVECGCVRRKLGLKPAAIHYDEGIMNLAEAKRYCHESDSTLMRLINSKTLPAKQVVTFSPFEIKKSDLEADPVSTIIKTLKKTGKLILDGSTLEQQENLFF